MLTMEGQHELGTGPRGMCLGLCVADTATPGASVEVSRLLGRFGNLCEPSAATTARPSQEAHSPFWQIESEEDFVECVRTCGLRADETLPWLEEVARIFGAPVRAGGIGLSRGRVQLWPNTTHYQWDSVVYLYPEYRRVLGSCGAWQLVWLGKDDLSAELEQRVCSGVQWVPTQWNLFEAVCASRRYGWAMTFPNWWTVPFQTVDIQFTLEVPSEWWHRCMAERIPGRKVIENVWGDIGFALTRRLLKDRDVRCGTGIVDETVTAIAHASAAATWAREERSIRDWYQWLRVTGVPYPGGILGCLTLAWVGGMGLSVCSQGLSLVDPRRNWKGLLLCGTHAALLAAGRVRPFSAIFPIVWWGCTYGWRSASLFATVLGGLAAVGSLWPSRTTYVCVNPRRRVVVELSDDWEFEAAPTEVEGVVPDPPQPESEAVESTLELGSDRKEEVQEEESQDPSEWVFEERAEGMEWVVPSGYYVKVGCDQRPNLVTHESRELGVHFQRSANFVVAKGHNGQPQVVRTWNQLPARPGYNLEMSGKIPELEPDEYGTGRVTYYQSFGIPGYWPSKGAHMTANTCTIRAGVAPPAPRKEHLGPRGEEWDFSKIKLLEAVRLPHVDFSRCIASAFPKDHEIVKEIFSPDVVDNLDLLKRLMQAMKPASRTRARLLIERILGGTMDMQDLVNNGRIKIFVKGDELLAKAKPRLICFVPTVWWILTVMWLTEVLDKVKNDWKWIVPHCGVDCYWASGMTQHKLSEAFTEAFYRELREGIRFVFVCGDDNIDLTDTSDASMYDSTQSGDFAECQFASMRAAGLPHWVTKKMQQQHDQNYEAKIEETKIKVTIKNGKKYSTSLPSGAAWTLFANSLGIIIYAGAVEIARKHFYPQGYPDTETRVLFKQAVASALGLSMKVEPNPSGCIGAEFLKGMFIPCGEAFWWTPVPSRLWKWAKALGTKVLSRGEMEERIRGVALSNRDALLSPMLRTWVDAWAGSAGNSQTPDWEYRTIDYGANTEKGQEELDAVQGQPEWAMNCKAVICERYSLSVEDYDHMCEEIGKFALTPRHFGGNHWARLAQRDYLGL